MFKELGYKFVAIYHGIYTSNLIISSINVLVH